MYCGKTADSIRMPFGMVSGACFGIRVLDGGPGAPKGKRDFEKFLPPLVSTAYFRTCARVA